MEENTKENYLEKYKDILGEDNGYEFFLKMQFLIPKYVKKSDSEYFSFITFAIEHLIKIKEKESVSSLLDLSINIYKKNLWKKNKIDDIDLFFNTFHKLYKLVPLESDKSSFKYTFLELCEKYKISDEKLYKENIYYDFAIDSIKNKFLVEGYRFALKSMNLEAINLEIEAVKINEKLKVSEAEFKLFVIRTCLEILINKDTKMAIDFITPFINAKDEYTSNEPLLNMCYFMSLLLNNKEVTFEKFNEFIQIYKSEIEKKDKSLKKYVNKISTAYFNKVTFIDVLNPFGGFNFMNMMKLVSNLANS